MAQQQSEIRYLTPPSVGMAAHYYDEDDIKINRLPAGEKASVSSPAKPVELTEEDKKAARDSYMTKSEIMDGLSEACKDIKLMREGKLKGRPIEELLNEL